MIKRTITNVYIDYIELGDFYQDLCIAVNNRGDDPESWDFVYEPPSVRDEQYKEDDFETKNDPHSFTIICVNELDEEERTACEWCPEFPVLYSSAPGLIIQFKDKTAREMIQLLLANLDTIVDNTWKNY